MHDEPKTAFSTPVSSQAECSIVAPVMQSPRLEYRPKIRPLIDSPEAAAEQFAFIKNEMREHFVCMTLDASNRMIACRVISIGTLTASLVHPREVFRDAILDHAAGIVVGHNHPSGSLEASAEDRAVTGRLRRVARLVGIDISYHIIITRESFHVA